jgi:hypothetical protein
MNATGNTSFAAIVTGLVFVLAGCATSTEVPPQTQEGLTDLRDQLLTGKAQIQRTTGAARDLTQRPQGQVQPQVERLSREVASLEELATKSRSQFRSQQQQSMQYFAQWDEQLKTMTNSVRDAGEERRADSLATFETLQKQVESLRQGFRPYMDALLESSRYLKTDATAAGVKTITPRLNSAVESENLLMQRIDAVIAQIDAMRGSK